MVKNIEYIIKNKLLSLSLLRKTKNKYYENLIEKSVVDNKLFLKTVKHILYDKVAGKKEKKSFD